jgi:hypothetical protein
MVGVIRRWPLKRAITFTSVSRWTIPTWTMIVADFLPAGMMTGDCGVIRLGRLVERSIEMPADGAIPDRETEIFPWPPARILVCTFRVCRLGARTVTDRVRVLESSVAWIVTSVLSGTAEVDTVNATSVLPAGTSTDPGTCTIGLVEARRTRVPPEGAGSVSSTRRLSGRAPVTVPEPYR